MKRVTGVSIAVWCGLIVSSMIIGTAAAQDDRGSIVVWGEQTIVPPSGLTDFIAIAAGDYHSLGLKSNGSIVAWGI